MRPIKSLGLLLCCLLLNTLSAQEVFTTKTGEKYHMETCRFLTYSKHPIVLARALELGYGPCKICRPPTSEASQSSYQHTSQQDLSRTFKTTTAVQCAGYTKSGRRCKRRTKNANQRCFQHE